MSDTAYFDRFFVFATVGLGLVVAGGANLAFGARSGRRVALQAVVCLAVCGLAAAALQSLTRTELAVRAAKLLGGGMFATLVFGSEWGHRRAAALVAVLRRPAARWGAVAVAGVALVVSSVIGFERAETAAFERQTLELELTLEPPPGVPTQRVHAVTDRGTRVVLKEPETHRDGRTLAGPEERILRDTQLNDYVIRRGGPTGDSNCHGWVFTGGKFLLSGIEVDAILKDNGYHETRDPHPGDVAVYRQAGAVAHTAVVRYVTEGEPVLVEGKWGAMGVFLHPADKSPYGTDYAFYRSPRGGHLLVGVGGSATGDAHLVAE